MVAEARGFPPSAIEISIATPHCHGASQAPIRYHAQTYLEMAGYLDWIDSQEQRWRPALLG